MALDIAINCWLTDFLSQGYEVKCLKNWFKKFYGRNPDLIGKYQRSVKDIIADSFPEQFNVVVQFSFESFFKCLVTWIVTFYQLMLVVTGVMHEADNAYSIRCTWFVLSACLISHNRIHLLIITTDFVTLY